MNSHRTTFITVGFATALAAFSAATQSAEISAESMYQIIEFTVSNKQNISCFQDSAIAPQGQISVAAAIGYKTGMPMLIADPISVTGIAASDLLVSTNPIGVANEPALDLTRW